MYNLSLTGIEFGLLLTCVIEARGIARFAGENVERYTDLIKVIESQTTPKAMGGET